MIKRSFIIEELNRKSAAIFPKPTPPLTSRVPKKTLRESYVMLTEGSVRSGDVDSVV